MRWAAGAVLVGAVPVVVGCSGSSSSSSGRSASPTPSTSAATPSSGTSTQPGGAGKGGNAGNSQTQNTQATPEGAVALWVTAVIEKDPKQLCKVSANPGTAGSPARPATAQECSGKGLGEIIKVWGPTFTPKNSKNSTGKPSVRVSQVPVNGNTAQVPARKIHVNGQSPVTTNGVRFNTAKIKGSWYVAGMAGMK